VLSSKVEIGRWALDREVEQRDLIQAAVARKLGDEGAEVDAEHALALVAKVRPLIEEPYGIGAAAPSGAEARREPGHLDAAPRLVERDIFPILPRARSQRELRWEV
jgi:hypothetical protein